MFSIDIDFDNASKAWLSNKKRVGQQYVYVCNCYTKKGKKCVNKSLQGSDFCYVHRKFK